jgi:hypothetical protein
MSSVYIPEGFIHLRWDRFFPGSFVYRTRLAYIMELYNIKYGVLHAFWYSDYIMLCIPSNGIKAHTRKASSVFIL